MAIEINNLAEIVNSAYDNGKPITVAYVDSDGQPHLSFRGTTQVHSSDQLAIWVREPSGGLPSALPHNPRLSLLYRDPDTRAVYIFSGRGHVESDVSVAAAIYDKSPEGERNRDPKRKGLAIVIDLDSVQGGPPDNRINMRRA